VEPVAGGADVRAPSTGTPSAGTLSDSETRLSGDLEEVLLDEVRSRLGRWQIRYAGRPQVERERLMMLALEREQIVAVAYREEAVAGRVAELDVDDNVRALVRQTLVWVWKDEQLHAEYLRGELLASGRLASHALVYARQLQGTLSGWTSSTANHRDPHTAPFRSGAAGLLVAFAGVTRQAPPALLRELHFQSFRRYCELNVGLEGSAALAYRRYVQLARSDEERLTIEQIRDDEERHVLAFRVLATAFGDDGRLALGASFEQMRTDLEAISPWFVPAALRPVTAGAALRPVTAGAALRGSFGSGARVVVRSAASDDQRAAVLTECLDRAGLPELAAGAQSAVIRASFMLGYDRRDCSNVNDPALLDALARYLRDHGVSDVAVLEAPTVYGNTFANRSVAAVAEYFGFCSSSYRLVDISEDLRPFRFERGFVQRTISGTWVDADVRIVIPKLRTDPTEFAHLCLSTLEGSTGAIDDTFYAGRRVDFRSATMMLLDVAPPDFAVVDAWSPVADGPFGVMGCARPVDVRHIYAGADVLAVDETVLADMGVQDPRRAPILRQAYHWFGLAPSHPEVDGKRPALGTELRGAHASAVLRVLGMASYPIYMYLSDAGNRFVPAMDTVAFPERCPPTAITRVARWATQRAFGLHAASGRAHSNVGTRV
jgi:uncharacterized protein (DUF362 family)